ncbi:MAG: hypothetical protein M3Q44_02130 [bacterium]|nr:hypothetical protein [bacterium]
MLQFVVQFLPLIFLCAAFGVVLLNFDSVAAYIVYVISMLIQPKELIHATNEFSSVPIPTPAQKKKVSFFHPLIRIWTLFIVLFFPSIDIEKATGRKTVKIKESQTSIYEEKTQEEANKYRIKTYSVPSSNNMSTFRTAMEPVAPLSSPFQQAFPDVVNILNKINKIENPVNNKPQTIVQEPENNISTTLPEFKAYAATSQETIDTVTSPTTQPAVIPEPSTTEFDAIAALERKVSELKKETVKTVVSKVDYGEMTKYSSDVNSGKTITISIPEVQPLPILKIEHAQAMPEESTVYKKNLLGFTMNLAPMLGQIISYTLLSLPLLMVVGSAVYYLALNGFDLSSIGGYPGWVSSSLENFVKMYIIKSA